MNYYNGGLISRPLPPLLVLARSTTQVASFPIPAFKALALKITDELIYADDLHSGCHPNLELADIDFNLSYNLQFLAFIS